MNIDLAAATAFMATDARALDRRRFQLLVEDGDTTAVLAAADGYRNPDGGYGWGLEPDLRSPESQSGGALHALEAFADIAPETTPRAVELCDWLASNTLADGGLPFALPVTDPAGCAPFWAQADPSVSSLQITALSPPSLVHVAGGTDEEMVRPLDFAPSPDRPVRALFTSEAIAAELRRLADQQQEDGGWAVDFRSYSPAAVLEWRGYATVRAVSILQRNAML